MLSFERKVFLFDSHCQKVTKVKGLALNQTFLRSFNFCHTRLGFQQKGNWNEKQNNAFFGQYYEKGLILSAEWISSSLSAFIHFQNIFSDVNWTRIYPATFHLSMLCLMMLHRIPLENIPIKEVHERVVGSHCEHPFRRSKHTSK